MKKIKRIMAALAAGVMAVTGMVMTASASSWSDYNLHYYPNIPSSQNVTVQTIGQSYSSPYSVTNNGYIIIQACVDHINCNSVLMQGYVYENITTGQYIWGYAGYKNIVSTGYTIPKVCTYGNAYSGQKARLVFTMNYSSGSISNSDGSGIAY